MMGLVEVKEECLVFVVNLQMFLIEMYVLAVPSVSGAAGRKQGPVGNIFSYLK